MNDYCKVVIIDDEYIMRQGMKHIMDWEKEGFQIVGEASNGQEGLDVIEREKPDIVMADVVMPVLNGIELSEILRKKYPEIQLIILSSYDKFEYVKSTFMNGAADYMLKPTLNPENLLEALNRAANKIPGMELKKGNTGSVQKQLERYLSGFEEQISEVAAAEIFPHSMYRLFGCNLKKICDNHKIEMVNVQKMITKFFEQKKKYQVRIVYLEEEYMCCILNYRVGEEKNVITDIGLCVDKIGKIYKNTFFVVGNGFTALQEARKRYLEEIKENVDQKFYHKDKVLISVTDIPQKKKVERFDFATYSRYLSQKQFSEAITALREYVYHICDAKMDEYRVKNQTKNLLYNFLMEIEKYDVVSEELKQVYFKKIDRVVCEEEFLVVTEELFEELDKIRIEKLEIEDIRILEIKQYIRAHYKEALDLADVAEKFGYNYHYLSACFSRYTKEGYSEYVNKVRIEKACELLEIGTMSISEVSVAIGYSDHSYFCRVFKKMTGKTPSQYKQSMKVK